MQPIRKRYIRFGDIPENEVSGVWCDTIKVREEKGVSVYDAVMIDGQWRIVLPHTLKKEVVLIYITLLVEQKMGIFRCIL